MTDEEYFNSDDDHEYDNHEVETISSVGTPESPVHAHAFGEHGLFLSDWFPKGSILGVVRQLRELADILETRESYTKAVLTDWSKQYNDLLNKFNDAPNEIGQFQLGDEIENLNAKSAGKIMRVLRHGYAVEYTKRWQGYVFVDNTWAQKEWTKAKRKPLYNSGQTVNTCKILSSYEQSEGFSYLVELAPYNGTNVFHISEDAITNYRVSEPYSNIEESKKLSQ